MKFSPCGGHLSLGVVIRRTNQAECSRTMDGTTELQGKQTLDDTTLATDSKHQDVHIAQTRRRARRALWIVGLITLFATSVIVHFHPAPFSGRPLPPVYLLHFFGSRPLLRHSPSCCSAVCLAAQQSMVTGERGTACCDSFIQGIKTSGLGDPGVHS